MSEQTAIVVLGEDYYNGPDWHVPSGLDNFMHRVNEEIGRAVWDYALYEIPLETFERWEQAKAAYQAVQEEVEQMMSERREGVNARRPNIKVNPAMFM